jgi:hydrogenase maturation protease
MKNKETDSTLVIGIGNYGRQDDGLGWYFLDAISSYHPEHLHLEYRYQLQIEDAELISGYDRVIFVDSTVETTERGFYLRSCRPSFHKDFTSHHLHPETVMYLCKNLFKKQPKAYILGIKGYKWTLKTGLSKKAQINLDNTLKFLEENISARAENLYTYQNTH